MPAKRKPAAPAAAIIRPGPGRPAVPGIDRRQSRSITLPASVWARLHYVTDSAGLGNLSALIETYLTTPAHLPKEKLKS